MARLGWMVRAGAEDNHELQSGFLSPGGIIQRSLSKCGANWDWDWNWVQTHINVAQEEKFMNSGTKLLQHGCPLLGSYLSRSQGWKWCLEYAGSDADRHISVSRVVPVSGTCALALLASPRAAEGLIINNHDQINCIAAARHESESKPLALGCIHDDEIPLAEAMQTLYPSCLIIRWENLSGEICWEEGGSVGSSENVPHTRAAGAKLEYEFGVAKFEWRAFLLGLVERQFELNWNPIPGSLCWLPKFAIINKLYHPRHFR
ncbi:hypothetical protein llap_2914 [Limosa lapponica baueri]|uniref:Uncharacterized protein n=1 Tax=Limosa lapponica baueri TaxID=1758121 RepID=A0A2I0ULB3_LIMLA|nr:hypothetical protein llap_2914 [Limosa lapponica baueri]